MIDLVVFARPSVCLRPIEGFAAIAAIMAHFRMNIVNISFFFNYKKIKIVANTSALESMQLQKGLKWINDFNFSKSP